jgi:hypothetical protein
MSYSTLSIQLLPNSVSNSATLTLTSSNYAAATTFVQNIGAWVVDNAGVFYPRTAILSITIS